ncbi:Uncharacterised protein [Shigella sonnei]|nr:Uncharacterised protein [Shigella sonnei]
MHGAGFTRQRIIHLLYAPPSAFYQQRLQHLPELAERLPALQGVFHKGFHIRQQIQLQHFCHREAVPVLFPPYIPVIKTGAQLLRLQPRQRLFRDEGFTHEQCLPAHAP